MQDYQQQNQQPVDDTIGSQNQYTPVIQNPQFTPYVPQQRFNQNASQRPYESPQNNQYSNYSNQQPVDYQDNAVQPQNQTYQYNPSQTQPMNNQGVVNPVQYTDPQLSNNQQNADDQVASVQQPISVSSGSPESSPAPMATEQLNQNVEYGYEKLQQIEKASENLQQVENKEVRNPQNDDQQAEKTQVPVSSLPPTKPQGPKIFGYHIPQSITTNIAAIRQNKGTGDPNDAKTWIYVLLDRLLKKQTYQD